MHGDNVTEHGKNVTQLGDNVAPTEQGEKLTKNRAC